MSGPNRRPQNRHKQDRNSSQQKAPFNHLRPLFLRPEFASRVSTIVHPFRKTNRVKSPLRGRKIPNAVWGLTLDYLSPEDGSVVWLGGIEHREMQGEDGALGELARYAHATAHRFHHAF